MFSAPVCPAAAGPSAAPAAAPPGLLAAARPPTPVTAAAGTAAAATAGASVTTTPSASASAPATMQLSVRSPSFAESPSGGFAVCVPAASTVAQLKDTLAASLPGRPAPADQRLIYAGRLLLDHQLLRDAVRKVRCPLGAIVVCPSLVCLPPLTPYAPG
ncbi:hypothetical protein BC831DRAFT_446818 [Entophlyctis helioformis]|nr:hypothetical protein BC831DRAFT_446818 [Entophlyctis helioformis]